LKNALTAAGLQIESQIALQALAGAGIDPTRRAETLSPSEFVALSVSLQKTMEGKGS
jgi:16S rRNA A1518/A1519 N6-dimethyltransferase RsmA/KsgA/DIM1 with predicted DNA glycosylase/AP lyase activity